MRRALLGLIAIAFASTATAASLVARRGAPQDELQPESTGPDSARLVQLLDALAAADPVICELVSDPIGNFWFSGGDYGIGQLSDTRTAARAAKDSVSRRISDPAAIRVLGARLSADDPCVRKIAADLLGNSSVTDDALGRLLDAGPARVREAALRATGERERPQLRGRIERMLGAEEASVAAMAAWSLGQLESNESVPALRRALSHESANVRLAAANALGEIADPAAVSDLERIVSRDTDRRVRHIAIEALGELEQPSSVDVLAPVLDGDDMTLSVAAAEAIGQLDELAEAPPGLVRALESTHAPLRRAAIEALVEFEDPSLAPSLLPHVTDADPEVRVMVIEALGEMRARSAVPALKRALTDPVADVRRAALEALADIDER